MVDREGRLRAALRAETEHVTVSPGMRRRIDARLRPGVSARTRLLVLSTALVLVIAGAVAWFVSGGRTVRRDVYAPPTPTPARVEGPMGEAEAAFRCFIEARRVRDIEAVKTCTTNGYQASLTDPVQFIGASSPGLERATIVSSSQQDDRMVFDVLLYWGRVEFVSEDTIRVVREGDRWLVDQWIQGEQMPVADTTEVTLLFRAPDVTPVCDGSKPRDESFVAVKRLVPTEVVIEDLALNVVRELMTGLWSHEGDAVRAFPPGSRVSSVSAVDEGEADVMVNDIALPSRPRCDYALWTMQETLKSLGLDGADAVRAPPSRSPEPDV